eukprot:3913676-Pyramimonas_sp.AAC.1
MRIESSASAWAWNSWIRVALERPSPTARAAATPMVPSTGTSLATLASTAAWMTPDGAQAAAIA